MSECGDTKAKVTVTWPSTGRKSEFAGLLTSLEVIEIQQKPFTETVTLTLKVTEPATHSVPGPDGTDIEITDFVAAFQEALH